MTLALASCLAASLACPPPQEPDRNTALIEEARKRLAAIAFEVPAGVKVAERDAREVIADLDAQQDVLFPPGGFAVQFELRRALGLAGPQGGPAVRAQSVASMARGAAAFYDPVHKHFVLLSTATRDMAELLAGSMLPLVVHELVHACQDAREGGLAKFFDARNATLDAVLVRRCVIEGEAELASVVAMSGEAAVENALLRGGADGVEKILAGELTALIYQHGRRLAGDRFGAAGWAGMQELWQQPPPSCEQVMHGEKLGHDVPQTVAVPAIDGTEVLHRTTLGELMIYFMLRERRLSVRTAALAAAGWDGDELVVLRATAGAAQGLVWRTVWDRDEDAAQFAAALPTKHATIAATGRAVDFVFCRDAALREQLAAACGQAKASPVANEQDAATTAAVEVALRAHDDASAVRSGRWELPHLGLSIPVPEAWELRELQGMKLLLDPATAASAVAVKVTVQALPLGPKVGLDAMVEANRTQLEELKITVVTVERAKCGEADVIRLEFHGRFGRTQPAVHCLQLIYVCGEQQVVVTATAAPNQMESHEKTLRALMAGVTVTPR